MRLGKAIVLATLLLSSNSVFAADSNPIKKVENKILNRDFYYITGYFAPYHFDDDPKSNWTFTFSQRYGGGTYQLLGDTSEENIKKNGIFGWVKRDVHPNPPMFYMVQYENTPFGWALFDIDNEHYCKNVYKLAGQDPKTKSFSYDIDGDGQTDTLSDLSCKTYLDKEVVLFFQVPEHSTFKFTKDWLNGKTLYYVAYTDFGYDEMKWNWAAMKFSNDALVFQEYETQDTSAVTMNYTVTKNGWIDVNIPQEEDDEENYDLFILRPIKITNDYVEICSERKCDLDNPKEYLFFDYQKAKNFVHTKNTELNSH